MSARKRSSRWPGWPGCPSARSTSWCTCGERAHAGADLLLHPRRPGLRRRRRGPPRRRRGRAAARLPRAGVEPGARSRPCCTPTGFRTLAPDQRGYSPGARPAAPPRLPARSCSPPTSSPSSSAVGGPVHLVGHDWGAIVGLVAGADPPRPGAHPDGVLGAAPRRLRPVACAARGSRCAPGTSASSRCRGLPERVLARAGAGRAHPAPRRDDAAPRSSSSAPEIVEHGALRGGLSWYRALGLLDRAPGAAPRHRADHDGLERRRLLPRPQRRRGHRALRRRALRAGRAAAASPTGSPPRRPTPRPRRSSSGSAARERAGHGADPAARRPPPAPEPLPHPVVDNHCHLDMGRGDEPALAGRGGAGRGRRGRGHPDRADRLRPARRALGGRGRGDVRRPGGRRRAAPQRGAAPGRRGPARRGAGRDRAARRRARQACARWGRPASTTSAPARRAAPRRWSRSAATSTSPSGSTRRWSSTTATPTTTCCAVLDEEGAPERWVMHCFSGDADFARALPRPRRAPVLRRHRDLQERRPAARGAGAGARSTGCWSRPTRRT